MDMTIEQFQQHLADLRDLGLQNNHRLTTDQLRASFSQEDLDIKQMLEIIQYLKLKGISIEDDPSVPSGTAPANAVAEPAANPEDTPKDDDSNENGPPPRSLSAEDEAYLTDYLQRLDQVSIRPDQIQYLFDALAEGDWSAQTTLTRIYMPVAAELAALQVTEDIPLSDLIQEANLVLLTALTEPEPAQKDDRWLRSTLRTGIHHAIDEQKKTKYSDEMLVDRAQKLEDSLKQLEEDNGSINFSIEELSILLDMTVDEIADTLKLTGDGSADTGNET